MSDRTARPLITGFEPFAGARENPSQAVVSALAENPAFDTCILPVAFGAADAALRERLQRESPAALLMFGLHGDRSDAGLRLERFAQNTDDAEIADNDGERRFGCTIDASAPTAYDATLPLDAFAARLEILSVPYRFSRDAGGFLCNHVFFRGRQWAPDIPCGFVHLPSLEQLSLAEQVAAAEALADCLTMDLGEGLRVQFAHGLEGSPRGSKARRLSEHFVCATPAMDTTNFEGCIAHHAALLERFRPDVLVGSSFGGAVAVALVERGLWKGPTLLLAQAACRLLENPRLPAGVPVVFVHGIGDEVIPVEESRRLAGERFPLWLVEDDHALHRSTEAGDLERWVRRVAAGQVQPA